MSDFTEQFYELSKLNNEEEIILKNLPNAYKWIARDRNGMLYAFKTKPYKSKIDIWISKNSLPIVLTIYTHIFKNIKWDDAEPYNFRK